jgi:3-hydroxyisobutyrate dehydrogenase
MNIGMLGFGRMGSRIGAGLVRAGFLVRAFDPAHAASEACARVGIEAAGTDTALATWADAVITVLPGRAETEAIMGRILRSMRPGSIWLDMTSGDPELTDRLELAAQAAGVLLVAAPIGGSPDDAEAGTLTFFVAGADAVVSDVMPILEAVGSQIERVGPRPSTAQTVKLVANLLWFGQAVAVTEALLLADSLGVDVGTMRRILPRTAGGSVFITRHLDGLLAGDYAETFGLDRVVEELRSLRALAAREGSPFELSDLVTRLHEDALNRYGSIDGELLVAKLLEERAGRTLHDDR